MSDLIEKVFRTTLGDDAWKQHLGREQNYREDCAKFEAMTDAQLVESTEYYMKNCQPPSLARGEPVYDAVLWHTILPELIRRLKK